MLNRITFYYESINQPYKAIFLKIERLNTLIETSKKASFKIWVNRELHKILLKADEGSSRNEQLVDLRKL